MAHRTYPQRSERINLLDAIVLDNTLSITQSNSHDTSNFREILFYLDMAKTATPSSVVFTVQFDSGGGNWADYRHWQWVDLRFVPTQMPLVETIPLSTVMGKTMRLQVEGSGVTASDRFTISAWFEGMS